MTGRMHAARIRETLTAKLLENHNGPRIIIHELGLRKGDCRVDVALVTERITGFEIKSDANGWNRLDGQVRMYSRALDEATLIVGRRTDSGRKRIPGWWGLWSARKDGRSWGSSAKRNRTRIGRRALSPMFLWRDEALALARCHGIARGVLSKDRNAIWDRLADKVPIEILHEAAVEALRTRRYDNAGGHNRSHTLNGPRK